MVTGEMTHGVYTVRLRGNVEAATRDGGVSMATGARKYVVVVDGCTEY